MDIAALCRASRWSASSAWKGITAIGSLRFPDDTQEGRFVQNAGEHGLGVMRLHRIVDASIFYLSTRGAAQMYNKPGLAVFISIASRWASAVQLLGLAITLFAPKFSARNHETLKVMCQHVNFLTVILMVCVMSIIRSRYRIILPFNAMFASMNFLPGQVRLAVYGPIMAVHTLIWIYVGGWSRSVNPEHAGAPLTTVWMWVQHTSVTVFMSFVPAYCLGTVLEMHARQSFVKKHCLEYLGWQPALLPSTMMQMLECLSKARSRLLKALGFWGKQDAKAGEGRKSCQAEGSEKGEDHQLLTGTSRSCMQDSCSVKKDNRCNSSSCAASKCTVPAHDTHAEPEISQQSLKACGSGPKSKTSLAKMEQDGAARTSCATSSSCCASTAKAGLGHAHRDVSLAVGYWSSTSEDAGSSPAESSSSAASSINGDVSEAQEVCAGVEGEQAQACQKMLDKGKAFDSKCRQLACRVDLLEAEVGKDSLAAMAEQVRSRQLLQQIATLTHRMNAQRCVATFLGSQEDALKEEVESLRKERKQLTTELTKVHTLVKETAADRSEATELLSRAVHIMESMRDHMSTERQAMWQCILQMLHLQPDATPAQASMSFARHIGRDTSVHGIELASFLQALAVDDALSQRPPESCSPRDPVSSSHSSCSSQSDSREGIQHGRRAGSADAPAAAQSNQREEREVSDPQLSEIVHHMGSCGLPDATSGTDWHELGDAGQEIHAALEGSSSNMGSEGPGSSSRRAEREAACADNQPGLLEVKEQQDTSWDLNIDGQVKDLHLSVLNRLDTSVAAQKEWAASQNSTPSGSVQKPCNTCKASFDKLEEAEAQHTGLQGAIVVVLRSMMGQEKSLREELGQLAAELDASLSARGNQPARRTASDPAEPSQLQPQKPKYGRRKCSTKNILRGASGSDSGCCWQGLEDSDEDGQDVRAIAQRLQQLSQATACSEQAASEVTEMLFPVPSIREINDALPSRAGSRSCPAEAHMARSLTMLATWLHSANSPYTSNPAGEHNSVERLRGALEVTVSTLVDRAFATQTAYVQCAASLSKQMQALTSLNTHLMNVCQNERRMLEMLMNNRARLLTHMAVLRTCSRVALCHECQAPAASDSLASSPAA